MMTWIVKRISIIFVLQPVSSIPGLCCPSSTRAKFMPWQISVTFFTWSNPFQPPGSGGWGLNITPSWLPFLSIFNRDFCLSSVICSAFLLSFLTPSSLLFCVSPTRAMLFCHRSHFSKLEKASFPKRWEPKSPLIYAQCTQSYFFYFKKKWLFTV